MSEKSAFSDIQKWFSGIEKSSLFLILENELNNSDIEKSFLILENAPMIFRKFE